MTTEPFALGGFIAFTGMLFGIFTGLGIAIGFELVMRMSGDGRAVILTWARTKFKPEDAA